MSYQVIDTHTKNVVGTYSSRVRATRKANRLDLEYGAIRHAVKAVEIKPKTIKTASGREVAVPPERTTGIHDDAIKTGGGIPAGVMKKAGNMPHDLVLFHDYKTGSTLALPENEVSPENVASHIAESRAKFSAGENKLSSIPGAIALKTE